MKIAHIFTYFGDGGAEAHALILAKKARDAGHEVLFIVNNFNANGQKKLQDNNIEVVYLAMDSSYNPIKMRQSVRDFKRIVQEKKIDVVHSHMLREQMVVNYAKLFGCKVKLIRTFHRFDQFNWKMRPFMPLFKKYTDAFIAISEEMSLYMQKHGLKKNIHLILNGVERVSSLYHEPAIGFIGRLTHEKGILAFIENNTLSLTQNKLVIAGDGPDYQAIDEFVKRECLNVELMGNVVDRSEFFSKISVLILPSETEVMPMVVLEAFSCGVPVVAFELEALKKIIKPENGKLIEFANYHEMARVAIEMLADAKSYSEVNMTTYEKTYSEDVMWQKTFELYYSLIN